MSVHRTPLVLKPAARRDIRAILLYTGEQWGAAQRDAYLRVINQAFATLREHPRIGRVRDDIAPGLRLFGVLEHTIYYRLSGDTVTVLRLLHRKVDASQHIG